MKKGRRGRHNPGAKLSEKEVREIRKLYQDIRTSPRGIIRWTQRALAKRFRISQPAVSDLLRGYHWADLK